MISAYCQNRMLYFQNGIKMILIPHDMRLYCIYMTLISRYMTFCLTVYDSVSSGNKIICGDNVFNVSI